MDQFYPTLSKNFQKTFLDKTEKHENQFYCVGVDIFECDVWTAHYCQLPNTAQCVGVLEAYENNFKRLNKMEMFL